MSERNDKTMVKSVIAIRNDSMSKYCLLVIWFGNSDTTRTRKLRAPKQSKVHPTLPPSKMYSPLSLSPQRPVPISDAPTWTQNVRHQLPVARSAARSSSTARSPPAAEKSGPSTDPWGKPRQYTTADGTGAAEWSRRAPQMSTVNGREGHLRGRS